MKQINLFNLVFSLLCVFAFSGTAIAQVDFTADGVQSLNRFNNAIIKYTSHLDDRGRLIFVTENDDNLGSVYGLSNSFGLLDQNNQWFIRNSSAFNSTQISAGGTVGLTAFATGKIRIGDVDVSPDGYRLFVQEGILAERVRVAVNGEPDWADYVFEDDFELTPLEDVQEFITKNGHLPNVPSAETMVETGLDVLESDAILLRKIEEAYLYILDQDKQLKELRAELAKLK